MSGSDPIYDMLNGEFANISFYKQRAEKEIDEMLRSLKSLEAEAITTFDRSKISDLDTISKKRQLLRNREGRYFEDLTEFKSLYQNKFISNFDRIPIKNEPADELARLSVYLMGEKDSLEKERLNIGERFKELIKFYGSEVQSRPNLLRNSGGEVLRSSAINLFNSSQPSKAQIREKRTNKAIELIDIVDDIERVREKANSLRNTDQGFINSLNTLLTELQEKDQRDKQNFNNVDSLDSLKKSFAGDFNKTSYTSSTPKPRVPQQSEPTSSQFMPSENDKLRNKLYTMEKALDFDSQIREMGQQRNKMLLEIEDMKLVLEAQNRMVKDYEDLVFEKNLARKEISSEIEMLRRERYSARDELARLRNKRQDLNAGRRRLAQDNRRRNLERMKNQMINVYDGYMDNQSTTYVRKQPFQLATRELDVEKLKEKLEQAKKELLSNQQTQGRGTIPQEIEQSDNSDVEDDDESSFD